LDWFKLYEKAKLSIVNRSKAIRQALDLLEENLEFLGITGVEDKLQGIIY
jgi:phospholipid-translocating ATPase